MTNWGRTVSPEELGDQTAAAITNTLSAGKYGFACIEMFKPGRPNMDWNKRDAAVNFPAWKDSLAIPLDTDLPSEVWASNIAVMMQFGHYDPVEIETSLRLLDYYGVNSAIVEIPAESSNPSEYEIRVIDSCLAGSINLNVYLAVRKNKKWTPYEFGSWASSTMRLAVVLNDEDGQGSVSYMDECFVMGVGMGIISAPVTGNNRVFLEKILARRLPILLTGSGTEELYAWLQSVRNDLPAPEPMQAILDSYSNVLQMPLQPLRDNLSSGTYDVFEQDPVKYDKYQDAMELALRDLSERKPASSLRIGILGAGRGPLVDRLLLALENLSLVPEKIFVVDKSPNAYMTLLRRNELEWPVLHDGKYTDKIEVLYMDIRRKGGPEKLDLVVSELLGSFGDNELAPECLLKAEKLLAKRGVMIPRSYTSWAEPVYCPQLSRKVTKLCRDSSDRSYTNQPYTCRIADALYPAKPERVFTCKHPSKTRRKLRSKKGSIRKEIVFSHPQHHIPHDGFAGYFSAVLYGPVTISTVRGKETPGMYSWFPFYLPEDRTRTSELTTPVTIDLTIERKWNGRRVWYEWNKLNSHGKHWSIRK